MARTDAGVGKPSYVNVGMVSLGCPKNLVDGESMLGLLSARGYKITPNADFADIIIVNTCGFIDVAKKESISAILDMADKKTTGRCRALIVAGCLSERFRESFQADLPEVDAVLGTGEYGLICDIVDELAVQKGLCDIPISRGAANDAASKSKRAPRAVHESTASQRLGHLNSNRVLTGGVGSVYIKIAEGCDNNCTYCIIPSIRGSYISRQQSDILAEAGRLSSCHDIEAVLVAQDTTKYGTESFYAAIPDDASIDLYAKSHGTGILCDLLENLAMIERIRWIRLMYAYPDRIDKQLISQFNNNHKLARYLDMPVQHASEGVLRGMGRRYRQSELYAIIESLRRDIPDIVLRTTVMTGFPGESDHDFSELLEFIKIAKFERLGVFTYSREEGTAAAAMPGQVPIRLAKKRRSEIMRVQAGIMSKAESARIGHEYEAIIVSTSKKAGGDTLYNVRTYAEAPEIDGTVRIWEKSSSNMRSIALEPGNFINVKITGMDAKGLYGVLLR